MEVFPWASSSVCTFMWTMDVILQVEGIPEIIFFKNWNLGRQSIYRPTYINIFYTRNAWTRHMLSVAKCMAFYVKSIHVPTMELQNVTTAGIFHISRPRLDKQWNCIFCSMWFIVQLITLISLIPVTRNFSQMHFRETRQNFVINFHFYILRVTIK